jgi:hypothetical protein
MSSNPKAAIAIFPELVPFELARQDVFLHDELWLPRHKRATRKGQMSDTELFIAKFA